MASLAATALDDGPFLALTAVAVTSALVLRGSRRLLAAAAEATRHASSLPLVNRPMAETRTEAEIGAAPK